MAKDKLILVGNYVARGVYSLQAQCHAVAASEEDHCPVLSQRPEKRKYFVQVNAHVHKV